MIEFLIGVAVGLLLYNYLGWRLLHKVYGDAWQLKTIARRLNPDAFKTLKDAIDEEATRRANL